jgi:ATP-dependent DNA helicase PIF1
MWIVWLIAAAVGLIYLLAIAGKRKPDGAIRDRPPAPDFVGGSLRTEHEEVSDIELNDEFRLALDLIEKQGESFFITGKAGTGKSTLLRYFRATTKKSVVVLAPTGIAAINVGGQTIHSFFHFPPRLIEPDQIRPSRDPLLYRRIEVLVIDEVSMVRADLMDGVDAALRLNRASPTKPFGGVQLVLIGDLFQLPPVVKERELSEYFTREYGGPFFFQAKAFRNTRLKVLELQKVYRQSDEQFIAILNAIRERKIDSSILDALNKRVVEQEMLGDSDATVLLTPTNRVANDINRTHLAKLPGTAMEFQAIIEGEFKESEYPTEDTLYLKLGARIMMLQNDAQKRWVNGTLGTIGKLSDTEIRVEINGCSYHVPRHRWENIRYVYDPNKKAIVQKEIGSFEQYPVRLAWALTIHKCQGQSFDHVYLDLAAGAFAHGQTYVALSRCRTLDGLGLGRPVFDSDIILDESIYGYKEVFDKVHDNRL